MPECEPFPQSERAEDRSWFENVLQLPASGREPVAKEDAIQRENALSQEGLVGHGRRLAVYREQSFSAEPQAKSKAPFHL